MKIITNPAEISGVALVATIGMFDGVHLGHLTLIDAVKREAAERAMSSAVVTFRDHPVNVLHGGDVKWICSLDDRIANIEAQGVDYLILMDFTPELAALDSTAFMQKLRDDYGLKALLVGFNHHFGHNRNETFADYKANGASLGVDVVLAPEYNGEYAPVSSSIIRGLIESGEVEDAMKRLSRPYRIVGEVVHGLKNGRKIGFPTANVGNFDEHQILPERGVYVAYAQVDGGDLLPAMANIGIRPTVGNSNRVSVEVNIFDFDDDIYHHQFAVYFVKRIRAEVQFESLDVLKVQLGKDRNSSRDYLENVKINKI